MDGDLKTPKRSIGMRVVKVLLGNDRPSFVASAAGVSLAVGILIAINVVYFSRPPTPPVWQTIGSGLVLDLF